MTSIRKTSQLAGLAGLILAGTLAAPAAAQEFPEREIVIEGHAVHLTTGEDTRELEQEQTLLPLSQDRAGVVKDALVERGVPEEMLSTNGLGGDEPIVDHTNEEERWKNRRVEFEIAARNY